MITKGGPARNAFPDYPPRRLAAPAQTPRTAPGVRGAPDGRTRPRKGKVALPAPKRVLLEIVRGRLVKLMDASNIPHTERGGGGDPHAGLFRQEWMVLLIVGRRRLRLQQDYRNRSHAAKAARDLAGDLGLDPWEDVEVQS